MSDWDTTPAPINNSSPALVAAVTEYQRLAETLDQMKEQHEGLLETIAAEFPIMSGEQAIDVNGMTVTCTRSERWTWDNELLEDLFASSDELPEHIKKRLTVNKRLDVPGFFFLLFITALPWRRERFQLLPRLFLQSDSAGRNVLERLAELISMFDKVSLCARGWSSTQAD